jgi:hypothetical protein
MGLVSKFQRVWGDASDGCVGLELFKFHLDWTIALVLLNTKRYRMFQPALGF